MKIEQIRFFRHVSSDRQSSDLIEINKINSCQELAGVLRENGFKLNALGTDYKKTSSQRYNETGSVWLHDSGVELYITKGEDVVILQIGSITMYCRFNGEEGKETNVRDIINQGQLILWGDNNSQTQPINEEEVDFDWLPIISWDEWNNLNPNERLITIKGDEVVYDLVGYKPPFNIKIMDIRERIGIFRFFIGKSSYRGKDFAMEMGELYRFHRWGINMNNLDEENMGCKIKIREYR